MRLCGVVTVVVEGCRRCTPCKQEIVSSAIILVARGREEHTPTSECGRVQLDLDQAS